MSWAAPKKEDRETENSLVSGWSWPQAALSILVYRAAKSTTQQMCLLLADEARSHHGSLHHGLSVRTPYLESLYSTYPPGAHTSNEEEGKGP